MSKLVPRRETMHKACGQDNIASGATVIGLLKNWPVKIRPVTLCK